MPSIYKTTLWAAQDKEAVAKTQDILTGEKAILNGNLVNPYYPNDMSFKAHGYIRSISISCGANISAVNFEVIGIQNGLQITENVPGPNANTVYSMNCFDEIISIIPTDGDVVGVSFGSGDKGFFRPISVNTSEAVLTSTALQVTVPQGGTDFTFSIYLTLDGNAIGNFTKFQDLIDQGTYLNPDNSYIDQTVSKIFFGLPPVVVNSFLVKVTTTSEAVIGKLIFIQL